MEQIFGTAIRCVCDHQQKMAEVSPGTGLSIQGETKTLGMLRRDQGLEIVRERHNRKHYAIIAPKELLQRLAGTLEGSAVVDYVQRVFVS